MTKKYSLRKVKVGVASVLVGFGVATTGAAIANAADVEVKPVNLEDVKKEAAANLDTAYKKQLENLEAAYKKQLESTDPQLSPEEIEKVKKEKEKVIAKLKEEVETTKLALSEGIDAGLSAEDVLAELDVKPNKADKDGKYPAPTNTLTSEDKAKLDEVEIRTREDEALNKVKPNHSELTQWVTEDGEFLLGENVADADQNLFEHHDNLLKEGYVFVKKEVDGKVTKYVYTTAVTEKTQWLDEDGDVLFEADGEKEAEFNNNHDILVAHGYIFLGSDKVVEDEKTNVTGYVYKKGPNYKKITSYVPTTAPVADALPEFKGGVNGAEPAVLEKPEFTEKTNEGRFVVEEGKAKADEAKAQEAKEGTTLPNTGLNSTSTTVAGLGLIALVGLAVRRKLAK